ncbi:MAG: phosphoenolpyruvate--protein phosphotransferase [Bacillota bacterium]
MHIIKGIPASKGIAMGPGFLCQPGFRAPERVYTRDTDKELGRLHDALKKAEGELGAIYNSTLRQAGPESAEIFRTHLMMLHDPTLLGAAEHNIQTDRMDAASAFFEAAETYAKMLESLPDEYLRNRAADVRDVAYRVVRILQRGAAREIALQKPAIIIAEDLTPSDTIQFGRDRTLGFFTAGGGTTSHTAILSRALGIPAVVGAREMPAAFSDDTFFILDGDRGLLIVDPDEDMLLSYRQQLNEQAERSKKEGSVASKPAITRDNKRVEVAANIGNLEDARLALACGAEGVGLFRTEFSYIGRSTVPDEEELVFAYSEILRMFGDHPVVVRTLDIGGDKEMPHLGLPAETNPFLGNRGIRLCLSRPDLFKPHLRAILRAGVSSNLHIMFPMIASVSEVREAKAVLNECISELARQSIPHRPRPKVGVMIEVPAAALCADQLAKEVDFFSIGTNDLTQYTMAADRTNPGVTRLASSLQPAVLRLIRQVVQHAHEAGIRVGMCGEMAGEPLSIPLLIGFGLDELSMNPRAIPEAKEIIRRVDTGTAKALADQAVLCETPEDVKALVNDWLASEAGG